MTRTERYHKESIQIGRVRVAVFLYPTRETNIRLIYVHVFVVRISAYVFNVQRYLWVYVSIYKKNLNI